MCSEREKKQEMADLGAFDTTRAPHPEPERRGWTPSGLPQHRSSRDGAARKPRSPGVSSGRTSAGSDDGSDRSYPSSSQRESQGVDLGRRPSSGALGPRTGRPPGSSAGSARSAGSSTRRKRSEEYISRTSDRRPASDCGASSCSMDSSGAPRPRRRLGEAGRDAFREQIDICTQRSASETASDCDLLSSPGDLEYRAGQSRQQDGQERLWHRARLERNFSDFSPIPELARLERNFPDVSTIPELNLSTMHAGSEPDEDETSVFEDVGVTAGTPGECCDRNLHRIQHDHVHGSFTEERGGATSADLPSGLRDSLQDPVLQKERPAHHDVPAASELLPCEANAGSAPSAEDGPQPHPKQRRGSGKRWIATSEVERASVEALPPTQPTGAKLFSRPSAGRGVFRRLLSVVARRPPSRSASAPPVGSRT